MVKYIFVHPVKGQIFGEASGQTSPLILTLRLWVVGIFSVIVEISVQLDVSLSACQLVSFSACASWSLRACLGVSYEPYFACNYRRRNIATKRHLLEVAAKVKSIPDDSQRSLLLLEDHPVLDHYPPSSWRSGPFSDFTLTLLLWPVSAAYHGLFSSSWCADCLSCAER